MSKAQFIRQGYTDCRHYIDKLKKIKHVILPS